MPFGHCRGGLKPPLPCDGGFTVNGFIPPLDGLPHGRSHKPFGICSCKIFSVTPLESVLTKSLDLKSIGINTYKKHCGGVPSFPPARDPCLLVCSLQRGSLCSKHSHSRASAMPQKSTHLKAASAPRFCCFHFVRHRLTFMRYLPGPALDDAEGAQPRHLARQAGVE